MKTLRITAICLAGVLLVWVLVDLLAKRNLRRADYGALAELFKARLGEAVSVPPREPGGVNEPAKLFDTYLNAFRVAQAVAQSPAGLSFPQTSQDVPGLDPNVALDAWGHPFCLARIEGRIAVISRGPQFGMSMACPQLVSAAQELRNQKSGKMYRYASGGLVLFVDLPGA